MTTLPSLRGHPGGPRRVLARAIALLVVCHALAAADTPNEGREAPNLERLAVKRVQPVYPPMAQQYKIQGVVTVQVTVGRGGKVVKAEFLRGHNIFRAVSLDAAKRWEFKPPDEEALEGTIRFTFRLDPVP